MSRIRFSQPVFHLCGIANRGATVPDNEGDSVPSQWREDVGERVANAVDCMAACDGDVGTVLSLRWQVRRLMETVKITDLTAPELIAMTAILVPANGRRLATDAIEKGLRPVLRLIDTRQTGDAPAQLGEQNTDLLNQVVSSDTFQPVL